MTSSRLTGQKTIKGWQKLRRSVSPATTYGCNWKHQIHLTSTYELINKQRMIDSMFHSTRNATAVQEELNQMEDLFKSSNAHIAVAGEGWGGVQGVRTPALFWYSPNCALKFLNQFRRNTLKNQFKKRKNPSKRWTNSILLKFFSATLRRILERGSHQ